MAVPPRLSPRLLVATPLDLQRWSQPSAALRRPLGGGQIRTAAQLYSHLAQGPELLASLLAKKHDGRLGPEVFAAGAGLREFSRAVKSALARDGHIEFLLRLGGSTQQPLLLRDGERVVQAGTLVRRVGEAVLKDGELPVRFSQQLLFALAPAEDTPRLAPRLIAVTKLKREG